MNVIFVINKRDLKPNALGIVPGIPHDKFNAELQLLPDYVQITKFYL